MSTREWLRGCGQNEREQLPLYAQGMEQTRGYMDRCGAEAGHLIVFDRAPDRPWSDKIFRYAPAGDGAPVTVWGM